MSRLIAFHGVIQEADDSDLRELWKGIAGWCQLLCPLRNSSKRCSNWACACSGGPPAAELKPAHDSLPFRRCAHVCGILAAGRFILD